MNNIRYNISAASTLWLLLCTSIIGYLVVGIVAIFMPADNVTLSLRLTSVFQQVFAFIAPAIVCAMIATRRPDVMLRLRGRISPAALLWTVAIMVVSAPAMEALVQLNEAIPLPESIYNALRLLEDAAQQATNDMLGAHTVGNLIVSLLIMAVMTGFSEEILFRGALCDALSRTRLGVVGTIWVSAAIFSLMHMQFFGFFPRMLLGAFFAYLLLRSGSLWLGVIAHALNNGMYIVAAYCGYDDSSSLEPCVTTYLLVAASVLLTAAAFVMLRRSLRRPAAEE